MTHCDSNPEISYQFDINCTIFQPYTTWASTDKSLIRWKQKF